MSGDDSTDPPRSRRMRQVSSSRVRRLVLKVGAWLFAEADAQARRRGWQVTVERGGLARSVRDPRFDRFARCPRCGGSRREDGTSRSCSSCSGDGRVVRAEVTGGGP